MDRIKIPGTNSNGRSSIQRTHTVGTVTGSVSSL